MSDPTTKAGRSAPSAALAAFAFAAFFASAPATASDADASVSRKAQFAQMMTREHAALAQLAAPRIEAIAESRAAAAAAVDAAHEAETLTVATRSAAPEAMPTLPARIDASVLDGLPAASGDAQWQCLAVLNRVDSRRYPNSVCAVTKQGVGSGRACQFSYACDGNPDVMKSPVARDRAGKLARLLIDGRPRTVSDGATHFHATYVRPSWSRSFPRTASIGNHIFYREPSRVAQR